MNLATRIFFGCQKVQITKQASSSLIVSLVLSLLLAPNLSYAQLTPINYDEAATAYQNLDFSRAEKIWGALAAEKNANAQYALAVMHLKGEASRPDEIKAYQLLKQAAQQNHLTAIFNLGVAYWEGTGTEVNKPKALNWWEVAARGNDSGAQFNLGLAYYIGDGRKTDVQKARGWIEKAAKNGHPQAPQLLDAIQRELGDDTTDAITASPPSQNSSMASSSAASITNTSQTTVSSPQTLVEAQPDETVTTVTKIVEAAPVPQKESNSPPAQESALSTYWQSASKVVSIRARPSASAIELKTLKPETPLKRLKTKGNWIQVHIPGNYAVWVHSDFIDKKGKQAVIKGTSVNIRPMPEIKNPDAAPVGQLNTGDKVQILLSRNGWVKILPQKSLVAWMLAIDAHQYRSSQAARDQKWVSYSSPSK